MSQKIQVQASESLADESEKSAKPPKFMLGTEVVVRPGTTDPDFPDIPLGGWSGSITEVDSKSNPLTYLINWNQHTLENIHPVYRKRCERDDLELESMWLDEADVEIATERPAMMEQPTDIVTRPLDKKDQEDRIKAILGLTSDDPLPEVDEEHLSRYHHYLTRHLAFPFEAKYFQATGPFEEEEFLIEVVELHDPDNCDGEQGLLCEAVQGDEALDLPLSEIEVTVNTHNRQLIEDYSYWLDNWQSDSETAVVLSESPFTIPVHKPFSDSWVFFRRLLKCGLYGAVYGVILGTILGAIQEARIASGIGAFLLVLIGCLSGSKFGLFFGKLNQVKFGPLLGAIFGSFLGAFPGALMGATLVALVWAYLGVIIGSLIGAIIGYLRVKSPWQIGGIILGMLMGACAGAFVQILFEHFEQALFGALWGIVIGFISGMVLYLGVIGAIFLVARQRGTW